MKRDESGIALTDARWAIIFVAWSLFGLAQTFLAAVMMKEWYLKSMAMSFALFMPRVWGWVLFTPVITLWDSRIRRRTKSVAVRISLHVPLYLVTLLAEAVIRRSTMTVVGPPPTFPFYITVLYFADVEAVRYVASLMLGRVLDASRELVRRDRRTVALKEELDQAQLHFLDLQLQPHFLFNALGSIAELAHEAPTAAARMVDHLTSLLRYATQSRTGQEVTLREELAALDPYLQIQRMRFPDWLSISERIDPAAEEALVPRMLLQPLVENAIRHGLSHRESGGVIVFSAIIQDDSLVISVYDNGAGLTRSAPAPGLGIGLGNIRERLATLYGDAQSLELVNHDVAGVEVILRIPFRRAAVEMAREADADESATDVEPVEIVTETSSPTLVQLTGAWVVAGAVLLGMSLLYVFIRQPPVHESTLEIMRRHVIHAGLWIALTPVVFALSRRFPISRVNAWATVPLHIIAGIGVALTHVEASRILVGGKQPPLISAILMDALFWNLAAYCVVMGISQRAAIEGWIREKDLATARIRAELTTARLSTVMVELRPDFLLAALTSLRALVTVNVPKAEYLLTSLADFLRLTMESLARSEITVERDIALLSSYAKVHRAGAGEYPEVVADLPPSLETSLVPTGMSRVLVECLVQSGSIPARVVVSVRRSDTRLVLRVIPDDVSNRSERAMFRDPSGRLLRLTQSGAAVKLDTVTSGIEAELPLSRGSSHVAQKTGSPALQYG